MATIQSPNIYWASDKQSGIEGTVINDIQASVLGFLWEERLNKKKITLKRDECSSPQRSNALPLLL